jgi:hypothetical protein
MKKLILAGNWPQALNYIRENGDRPCDYLYASTLESVMGLNGCELVRIGSWTERKDAAAIEAYLSQRGMR